MLIRTLNVSFTLKLSDTSQGICSFFNRAVCLPSFFNFPQPFLPQSSPSHKGYHDLSSQLLNSLSFTPHIQYISKFGGLHPETFL